MFLARVHGHNRSHYPPLDPSLPQSFSALGPHPPQTETRIHAHPTIFLDFALTLDPRSSSILQNVQNFNEEGVGVCDSGEYCRFVHPGPRWANARPYNNPDEFEQFTRYLSGGGGSRGRPGGGGGSGRPLRRCRVSPFAFFLIPPCFSRLSVSALPTKLWPSGAS